MRGTNRKRSLIVSGSVILLCMTIIVGVTLTLFTEEETVVNHLKAGNLEITLERTGLTSTYLTDRGFLTTETDDTVKDFTNDTSENVFALEDAVIVPKSKYVADMRITNNSDIAKSNVAFAYWIEIIYTSDINAALSEQIEVVVKTDEDTTKRLKQGVTVGSEDDPVGIVPVGRSADFSVSIEFLDFEHDVNNLAQGENVSFDLVVHAVQYTEADPIETS